MDKRTLRKILPALEAGQKPVTRIDGYRYRVEMDGDEVSFIPLGHGDVAHSFQFSDCYEFTHGGPIFREAVKAAISVKDALVEKRAGQDQVPAFLDGLTWNGQITRWFDASGIEYDLAPSNAAVARGEKIYQVSFTTDGYEITHVFNEDD